MRIKINCDSVPILRDRNGEKKRLIFRNVIFFLLFWGYSASLFAQDQKTEKSYFKTTLHDGNVFLGEMVSSDSMVYVLKTEAYGRLELKKQDVAKVEALSSLQYHRNKNKMRYVYDAYQQDFQGQTGFGPKKGEVSYRNSLFVANDVEVGLTNFLSLQSGFTWTFVSFSQGFIWLTPKLHFPIVENRISTSLSFFHLRLVDGFNDEYVSFWQSATSVRLGDHQITTGIGYGKNDWEDEGLPMFSLSAQLRLGKNAAFITENYFIRSEWQNIGAHSFGFRFGRRGLIDLGLGLIKDDYGDLYPIPIVQFRKQFNKKNG